MNTTPAPHPIREFSALDATAIRRDVLPDKRPAILRGLVGDWPAVKHGLDSPAALVRYLNRFDSGKPVDALLTAPEIDGQIFYDDAMTGFNFLRNRLPLAAVAEQVLRYAEFPRSPAVAAQSALIRDCLPGFAAENSLSIVDDNVLPRIWLGNRITTPTHVDEWNNVGCVVAGRRRFTLFPPEQIGNLYIGPLDFAPTGAPMSLVSLRNPDFQRYPKFREALAAAQTADLAPGDAIFIPPLWWHHVESLEKYNALVNYWWKGPIDATTKSDSAFDPLIHSLLNLKHLSPEQRKAWGVIFDYYLFGAGDDLAAHIPEHKRGVLGEISPELAKQIKAFLVGQLQR